MYVLDDAGIKQAILQRFHDAPLAGHYGVKRTKELIQRQFHWDKMEADIDAYVASCRFC